MKLDRFINRPVLSTVISILIVILGILGLFTLPITQYPDIAPPTVSVRATYTGANAQTVLNSVIAPLEDQINGVENMMYMTSNASNNGSADISIYFKQGTDPDMAAVNVQNRVSMAQGLLPAEVTKIGVTTQKRQNSMLVSFITDRILERLVSLFTERTRSSLHVLFSQHVRYIVRHQLILCHYIRLQPDTHRIIGTQYVGITDPWYTLYFRNQVDLCIVFQKFLVVTVFRIINGIVPVYDPL